MRDKFGDKSELLRKFKNLMKRRSNDDDVNHIKADEKTSLTEEMIKKALKEIKNPLFAKLTGLVAHITYW